MKIWSNPCGDVRAKAVKCSDFKKGDIYEII
uniref:Uncharacterized protein n=1 Tax=Siphoviridae sp. ctTBR23 TaxID=2825515 RepID=A0A8S5NZ97_9CAUD|nr:MAG TPA: hypothetical protein [Siphoviridae sp. ctTBR23]DAU76180.1 MAG TPA: hypothetical protein [Caudoviricetes sp.]